MASTEWDHQVDFLVVGSGGGGMAAALSAQDAGLSALIVEKAARFGGSTAISGGAIWIPNNPTLRAAGQVDPPSSVRSYLDRLTEGKVSPERLDAYVTYGPEAMELLHRSRWMKFYWIKGYADYHPEWEGGKPRGRSVECLPFDTRKLGDDEQYQRPNSLKGPLGLWVTSADYRALTMVKRTWRGRWKSLVAAWRVSSNTVIRRHMATGGRSLVARLRMALKDAGVPLWLQTPMTSLVVEDGKVVGIEVERSGRTERIHARRGVLLACGGFDHDPQLRETWLPEGGQVDHSMGAAENTGDGIKAGSALGAALDFMDDAWWMPSVRHPRGADIGLVSERAIPGHVIVDSDGRRFTNEAAPYVNFVHDQFEGKHLEAWFVMDSRARSRYPFAQVLPGVAFPDDFYQAGTVHRADTVSELARAIGVPEQNLSQTLARFNSFARAGVDEDFHRGESAYDRYYGDPTLTNPNLDLIDKAPFYAVRLDIGDLGTKGGLVCDEHSRVLREDGTVIEGLYATGNASASVMANEYAGPGATIGPSITFGYIAAKHAAAAG